MTGAAGLTRGPLAMAASEADKPESAVPLALPSPYPVDDLVQLFHVGNVIGVDVRLPLFCRIVSSEEQIVFISL